ncbi:MAG TPA: carboxypeptidase-like regulatory domain-containing protein, partial [Thermoproteota archaeon]|nr:carboxypeptidase-like regulatory domain-containing protein [Thermoproteota archaeon]
TLKVVDQSPSARSIASAPVTITMPDAHPAWVMSETATSAGEVTLNLVPAGRYEVVATSPNALYGKPASQIAASLEARVIDGPATVLVPLPIFDATVTLVTPSGKPIVGANVAVGGNSQTTDATGDAVFTSIPSGSYTVTASWFGLNINPTAPLTVTLSRTYLLTASNIALVSVQVVGAQSQGLSGANVVIKTGSITVFNGMASSDGTVALELPYGTYDFHATYKSVTGDKTAVAINADTVVQIPTGVFIELFGQGLSFAGFALWVIAVLIVVLILVIAAQEYNIYRRKRLPQLFGAGPAAR